MPTSKKTKKKRPTAAAPNRALPTDAHLLDVYSQAPPEDKCQHQPWTMLGGAPGRVRCKGDCGRLVLLEEALDAQALRAWGVR